MNILLTGGTGFLGKHIIKDLHSKFNKIIFIGRNEKIGKEIEKQYENTMFVNADLNDISALEIAFNNNIEMVIHSAAKSSPWGKYNDFYEANVIGTKNILDLSLKYNIERFIHISTPSIYFNGEDKLNILENSLLPEKFINHYAKTKFEAEKLVTQYKNKGLNYIGLRPRGLFGEEDTSILPRVLKLAEKGYVPVVNHGQAIIDMTYVKNVVYAIELSINANENALNDFYNITNGESLSVISLMKLLLKENPNVSFKNINYNTLYGIAYIKEFIGLLINKEPSLTRYSVGLIAKSQTLSIEKAKEKLGYKPIYSIETGIRNYLKWKKVH